MNLPPELREAVEEFKRELKQSLREFQLVAKFVIISVVIFFAVATLMLLLIPHALPYIIKLIFFEFK